MAGRSIIGYNGATPIYAPQTPGDPGIAPHGNPNVPPGGPAAPAGPTAAPQVPGAPPQMSPPITGGQTPPAIPGSDPSRDPRNRRWRQAKASGMTADTYNAQNQPQAPMVPGAQFAPPQAPQQPQVRPPQQVGQRRYLQGGGANGG